MHDFLDLFLDVLRNSFLITGLVIIMMLMIEYINIHSEGRWFSRLRQHRFGQVVLGAGLGIIPGCMGGFAAVSMYSHKLLSFGALVAMMIASSGDEAFVMLAMIPKEALILTGVLFVIAILVGWIVDLLSKKKASEKDCCEEGFQLHHEEHHHGTVTEKPSFKNLKHASAERIALLLGVVIFIIALAFGLLEHDHEHEHEAAEMASHVNIFDEYWLNLIFAVVSLFAVWFIATASEHVVKEHLWEHVIRKHFLSIFLWTFGALMVIEIGLHYLDMESWINSNIVWMILLAVLVGIIPESGPHMLFVTLFATGMVPFSVLLASSISQDGHASLPLLAESKRSFVKAKIINALVAAVFGYLCYFIGF
ncbi:MAG: putative manganese transporter [Bacteroidales bacterium]|nr:putative manganese transporter [Bacteroidales bacterium]